MRKCRSTAPPMPCKSHFCRKCGCSFASNQASILILLAWLMSGVPFCLTCYHMATSRVYKFSIKCFILLAGANKYDTLLVLSPSLKSQHLPCALHHVLYLHFAPWESYRCFSKQSLLHQYASLNLGHILLRVVEKAVVTGHWMRDLVLLCCVHSPIVVSGYITWGGS